MLLLVIALGTLLAFLVFGLDAIIGGRRLCFLSTVSPAGEDWPSVSIVIAARNEELKIETALRSLLEIDYPRLEIVLVNDRSTDKTGAIINAVAAHDHRVSLVTIE